MRMPTSRAKRHRPPTAATRSADAKWPAVPRSPFRLIVATGVAIAAIDLIFAGVFWGMRGVTMERVLQSIAAGWLGSPSYSGGWLSAVLGALSHTGIAVVMVAVYDVLARRLGRLWVRDWWLESGVLYGALLFGVMNLVVVPLSRASAVRWSEAEWHLGNFLMHVLIGILCTAPQAWSYRQSTGVLDPRSL